MYVKWVCTVKCRCNLTRYLLFALFHIFFYIDHAAIILSEIVKQKGLEHVTVDDLVAEITPKGRG